MPQIVRLAAPTPTEREAILAPLDAFSRAQGFIWQPEPLTLVLRDDEDRIVGGVIGETNWGWLHREIARKPTPFRGGRNRAPVDLCSVFG